MWKENLNNITHSWLETTDTKSVVSNHVNNVSDVIHDILNFNQTNPLINKLLNEIEKNTKIISLETDTKIIIWFDFILPNYSNFKNLWKSFTKKIFNKTIFLIVKQILINLWIKCKWETKDKYKWKMIKTWVDSSWKWSQKREIRFVFSDDLKYLKVNWIKPIDETYDNLTKKINYWKQKYVFINTDTKILEIFNLIYWVDWIDVYWKTIKHKKTLTIGNGISIEQYTWTKNHSYYSTLDWFIQNNNWNISITDVISVWKLDFDINLEELNKNPLKIKVKSDVVWWPYKFKWNLSVWKHLKANTDIKWNIDSTCIMWNPNKNISVQSSWIVKTTSISNANISWKYVSIENNQTWQAPFIWNNNIKTNHLKISNWLIKWDLIINIWDNLLTEYSILKHRINKITKDIKNSIEQYRIWVEEIERNIRDSFLVASNTIEKDELNELEKIFWAIKSLLYLEPFQIKKIRKFLNYIHEKHDFNFIWWYKKKFNYLNTVYDDIISSKDILIKRENKLTDIKHELSKIVICFDWDLLKNWKIKLYIWNKITKSKQINTKKYIKKWKINIYKKYSLEEEKFVDISKEEAEKILLTSKVEIS